MKTIHVRNQQSLFDIAIETYGDVEGVYFLVADNHLHSIIDNLSEGQLLHIRDGVINREITERAKRMPVVTSDSNSRAEGIGFWALEMDFSIT